jgi:4-hydroxy-tetrahydrodipicolinate synthase
MSFQPKGVIPALITPLDSKGNVSESATRKLLNFVIDNGVHGVFVIGTTGEFYGLTFEEKRRLMEITVDEVKGRVPVYAGTGALTTRECIELTRIASECKVDAVSVLTPMFITPNQNELYEHYRAIADSTDLPVLLYNNLPKTGVTITAATVAKLAQIENIVAIKDSTGDMTLTGEYIRLTKGKGFSVLMGRDTLIHAALCYGAHGAIAACANVAPRICADIYDLYMKGDIEGSLREQYRLAPLRIAFALGTFPAVIKEALELLGIEAGPCMAPVGKMSEAEHTQLKKILMEMGLIGA